MVRSVVWTVCSAQEGFQLVAKPPDHLIGTQIMGCRADHSQSQPEKIQGYANRNEWKKFLFSAIKAVYGPPTEGTAPLLSADGRTLLTDKTRILQRWAEHFRDVLNRPSAISDAAIECLPQVETNVDLHLPPSLQETIRTVQQLSTGKAPGSDAIPAKVFKH
nr:unnamed protein product [Spirometra erinaceieuropaei]